MRDRSVWPRLRLIQTNLNFSPAASVRWIHDVFGNSIAIASFAEPTAELRIESRLQLETYVVKSSISYQSRETEGTQTPVETLNRGWGSCRDLTVLLIEAARCLGFGARVVTGYLYNPFLDNGDTAAIGAGTTHAWADIYLPGAGWIAYDPTNGTINGGNLIRVAVTRDISQAVPVGGSFVGAPGDYLGMTVDVAVISERRAESTSA
jgi:transglutaminase-like putative cysteine protease